MSWSLGGVIREQARRRGDGPMITFGARTITWSEMDARSSRVAQALLAAGLAEQSRVAFLDKNGPEYFEVLLGGGKANAVNVAVNWRLTPAEMEYIINDAGARVLVVGPDFIGHLDEMEPTLKTVEKIVVIGGHPRHEAYEEWVARHPAVDPGRPVAPTDVAMQLYTSGTTGLPKGAMLTNANLGTLLPHVGAVVAVRRDLREPGVHAALPHRRLGLGAGRHGQRRPHDPVREFVPAEILDHAGAPPGHQRAVRAGHAAVPHHGARRGRARLLARCARSSTAPRRSPTRCWSARCRPSAARSSRSTGSPRPPAPSPSCRAGDHDVDGPRAHLLRSAGKPFPWVELRIVEPGRADLRAPARSARCGPARCRT